VTFTVRRLQPADDRSKFRSGNPDLDRFFHQYAGQNQFRHHIGATYVALDEGNAIVGFATVAASELPMEKLPNPKGRRLPAYPFPILRLARLAVDSRSRGRGVSSALLNAVFALTHRMAADLGCVGIVVDAKPEAVDYYLKLEFVPLEAVAGEMGDRPVPLPMFLELGAIPRSEKA